MPGFLIDGHKYKLRQIKKERLQAAREAIAIGGVKKVTKPKPEPVSLPTNT